MNSSSTHWQELANELHPRLAAVGFRVVDFPLPIPPQFTDVTFSAFEATYGLLFCAQIGALDLKTIAEATNFACDSMRDALTKSGANDWSRDGYVLAAVLMPPGSPEVATCLRNFEQSRAVCRRHVIWPGQDTTSGTTTSWGLRLDRVTVLSLPEAESPTAVAEQPMNGPAFIETINSRLKGGASYKTIAEELVRAAREREDFHAT